MLLPTRHQIPSGVYQERDILHSGTYISCTDYPQTNYTGIQRQLDADIAKRPGGQQLGNHITKQQLTQDIELVGAIPFRSSNAASKGKAKIRYRVSKAETSSICNP